MSAFIVSDNHINVLVNFCARKNILFHFDDETINSNDRPDEIGQILLDENYKSVNNRYNENAISHKFKYNFYQKKDRAPIEIIKACRCLNYQSCESKNYYSSKAYEIINKIIYEAIDTIDGYEDADWEIK